MRNGRLTGSLLEKSGGRIVMLVDCKATARSTPLKVTPLMVTIPGKVVPPTDAKNPPTCNVDPGAHGAGLQLTLAKSIPNPGVVPIAIEMFGPEAPKETSLRPIVAEPEVSVNVSAFAVV